MTDHTAALAAIPENYAQPDADSIAYLPKGGAQLAYMGHAEVTLALLAIDPLWTWEPLAIIDGVPVIIKEQNRYTMWAKLTVLGKTIIGVGTCEARKGDPEKELIGDFLRNAAMRFGIGTKLWSKATSADPAGRDDVTRAPRQTGARSSDTTTTAPMAGGVIRGISELQKKKLHATFNDKGITDRDAKLEFVTDTIGHPVASSADLTRDEAAKVIDALEALPAVAA